MSDLINLTTQDRILTIQMNRPDKKECPDPGHVHHHGRGHAGRAG